MKNFIFENVTKTYFGEGCVKRYLPDLLKNCGETVMLVYSDASVRHDGIYGEVTGILRAAKKGVVEISGITAEPTYEKALEGAGAAKKNKVGFILGIGGSPVIDCCKVISLAARYGGDVWADFWMRHGEIDFTILPMGVIAAGTAAKNALNGGTMITNRKLNIKAKQDYPKLNPRFVMLDPGYTYDVPIRQMISEAFDTLSHIMEIYFSEPDGQDVPDDIFEALMRGMIRELRAAVRHPESCDIRSNLMWQTAMAENRIEKLSKRIRFECHMMERPIGQHTGCDHGERLAVLHLAYYRHICAYETDRFARFATRVWRISADGKTKRELAYAGIDALEGFIRELGLPTTFRELGIDETRDLKTIADSCDIMTSGYKLMSHGEIYDIFLTCI